MSDKERTNSIGKIAVVMEERGDIRGIDCIIPAIRKYIFTNLLY
jgi:hypothetical protein